MHTVQPTIFFLAFYWLKFYHGNSVTFVRKGRKWKQQKANVNTQCHLLVEAPPN